MRNEGIITAANIYFESINTKCQGYIDVNLHCPVRETKVIICGQNGTIVYDPGASDTLTLVLFSRFQRKGQNKKETKSQTQIKGNGASHYKGRHETTLLHMKSWHHKCPDFV